jgi:hypothetical protein
MPVRLAMKIPGEPVAHKAESRSLSLRATSIDVGGRVTPLDPRGNSEAGATGRREAMRPAFGQSAAPPPQAAVCVKAAA